MFLSVKIGPFRRFSITRSAFKALHRIRKKSKSDALRLAEELVRLRDTPTKDAYTTLTPDVLHVYRHTHLIELYDEGDEAIVLNIT